MSCYQWGHKMKQVANVHHYQGLMGIFATPLRRVRRMIGMQSTSSAPWQALLRCRTAGYPPIVTRIAPFPDRCHGSSSKPPPSSTHQRIRSTEKLLNGAKIRCSFGHDKGRLANKEIMPYPHYSVLALGKSTTGTAASNTLP